MESIFRSFLENGEFPTLRKKVNGVPAHKKGDNQNLKNYLLISLLPVAGKIFIEKILENNMYKFFAKKNLISPNQSGFKPGNSYINQLLSISDETYKSFDDEVPGIFLTFQNNLIWHKGLLYKLKQNGISEKLFAIITDFLKFKNKELF